MYLKHNKDSIFWSDFQYIDHYVEYLSYFPTEQTAKQIRNITEFYRNHSISEDAEFIYLKSEEMDDFVVATVQLLNKNLYKKIIY